MKYYIVPVAVIIVVVAALVDIEMVISMLLAQAPLVAVAILVIILYMERGFTSIRLEMERRFARVEEGLGALIEFDRALLRIQVSKGVISTTEYEALVSLLSLARATPSSKYYTREVYERLGELLKKKPDEITWEDVFELERIYDLLMKEAAESNRPELARYAGKLLVLITMAEGFLLKRGVLPGKPEQHA